MEIKKLRLLIFLLLAGILCTNNAISNNVTPIYNAVETPPSCDLPAPTNIQVAEIAPDWVALSWTPNGTPPAQYRIRTYDANTNALVNTTNVAGWATSGRVLGLSPNVLYYSRITPVCSNGFESINSGSSPNYRTIVIDLIISGFAPATGTPICSLTGTGASCVFSNTTGEVTTFRIQPDGNADDARIFGLSKAGSNLFETKMLESNEGQNFVFQCGASNGSVPCSGSSVDIKVANTVVASFTVIATATGVIPPRLYCTFLNEAYEIVRLAPGFTSDEDRAVKPNPAMDGAHISAVPNPFNDHIDVRFDVTDKSASVALHLYDLQGRLVMSHLTDATQSILSLPTEDLLPGMYFLRVEVGDESRTIKVVKTQ